MYSLKIKSLMVVLMLLVFVGQATASAVMPCEMDAQTSIGSMMMDHDMSDMASGDMNCCDQDCSCPMGSCVSAVFINTPVLIEPELNSQKIVQYSTQGLIQTLTSLYRPPILS
ncbi:MAG: hypothetical protein HRT35_11940 [Algicola sp.]|nr:hypothetical protein [Algicola sp.]